VLELLWLSFSSSSWLPLTGTWGASPQDAATAESWSGTTAGSLDSIPIMFRNLLRTWSPVAGLRPAVAATASVVVERTTWERGGGG
jgi:hypothetical protein